MERAHPKVQGLVEWIHPWIEGAEAWRGCRKSASRHPNSDFRFVRSKDLCGL